MALSKELKAKVLKGAAHWVTVKEGPLKGRHLLIDGARPAEGEQSKGIILAGHGIPIHVIEKITGATHARHLEHEQIDHDENGMPDTSKNDEWQANVDKASKKIQSARKKNNFEPKHRNSDWNFLDQTHPDAMRPYGNRFFGGDNLTDEEKMKYHHIAIQRLNNDLKGVRARDTHHLGIQWANRNATSMKRQEVEKLLAQRKSHEKELSSLNKLVSDREARDIVRNQEQKQKAKQEKASKPKISAHEKRSQKLESRANELLGNLKKLHAQGLINDHHLFLAREAHRSATSHARGIAVNGDDDTKRNYHDRTASSHIDELEKMHEQASRPHVETQKMLKEVEKYGKIIRDHNNKQNEEYHPDLADETDLREAEKIASKLKNQMEQGEDFNKWDYEDNKRDLERKLRHVKNEVKSVRMKKNDSSLYAYQGQLLVKRG